MLCNKNEYAAIDYFKLLCAFLVVSIHLCPFLDVNQELSYWFNHVICRLAVPFFFLAAGFFIADNLNNTKKTLKYLGHILLLYVIYTILHLKIILASYSQLSEFTMEQKLQNIAKSFFFQGTYIQLWYLPALLFAVILLYILAIRMNTKSAPLLMVAVFLYIIGVLGNGYFGLFDPDILSNDLIREYYSLFQTTRNGLFFGFPFVTLGYLIKKNDTCIRRKGSLRNFIIALVLLFMEAGIVYSFYPDGYKDMLMMLLPAATYFFITVAFIPCENIKIKTNAITARKLSTFVYVTHMLASFYAAGFLWGHGIYLNSMERYVFVILFCMISGYITIRLSRIKHLRFLKVFY